MRAAFVVFACITLLAACGIKRPLVAPRDIPAYEQKQQEKLENKRRFEEERMRQDQALPPAV